MIWMKNVHVHAFVGFGFNAYTVELPAISQLTYNFTAINTALNYHNTSKIWIFYYVLYHSMCNVLNVKRK